MSFLHKFRVLTLDRLERRRVLSHTAGSAALAFDIAPRLNLTAEFLKLQHTPTVTPATLTSTHPGVTTRPSSTPTLTLLPTTTGVTAPARTTTTVTTYVPTAYVSPPITTPNTSLPLNATTVGLAPGLGRTGTAFGVGNGNSSQFNPAITTPYGSNLGFNSPANLGYLNITNSGGATGLTAVPGYNPVTIGYNPNDPGIGSTTAFPSTNTGYTTGLGFNSGLGFTTGVGFATGVGSNLGFNNTGVGYTSGLASTSGVGVGMNSGFLSDGMNMLGSNTGTSLNPGTFLSPLSSGNVGLGNFVSPGLAGIYSNAGYLGISTPGFSNNPSSTTNTGTNNGFTTSPYTNPSFGTSSSFSSSPFVSPYGAFSELGF